MPHTFTCQTCDKTFSLYISQKRAKERRFCSQKCASIGLRKPWKICPICGKEFRPYDDATTYCSKKCYFSTFPQREPSTCKHCGKQFLDPKHPHKQYCGIGCFRQAKARKIKERRETRYVTINCKQCGKNIKVTNSEAKFKKYCSKECRLKSGWKERDPTKRAIFTCEWCKKDFESWVYRPNRFCSNQCRSEYGARQPKPNARKPEIHITRTCEYCGKTYQTTTHQVRLRNSRFCSYGCRYASLSIERRGENNPHWNGGSVDPDAYGSNWYRQKRKAKKRDNHTCQVCGYRTGGKRFLDVHHIIPIKKFNGDWQKANMLENLISLCRRCHIKVEMGKIPCQLRLPIDTS